MERTFQYIITFDADFDLALEELPAGPGSVCRRNLTPGVD